MQARKACCSGLGMNSVIPPHLREAGPWLVGPGFAVREVYAQGPYQEVPLALKPTTLQQQEADSAAALLEEFTLDPAAIGKQLGFLEH